MLSLIRLISGLILFQVSIFSQFDLSEFDFKLKEISTLINNGNPEIKTKDEKKCIMGIDLRRNFK